MKENLKELLFLNIVLQIVGLLLGVIMHLITMIVGKDYPVSLYLIVFGTNICASIIFIFLLVPFFDWVKDKLDNWNL